MLLNSLEIILQYLELNANKRMGAHALPKPGLPIINLEQLTQGTNEQAQIILLMRRPRSLEKAPMLGRVEGKRISGQLTQDG